MCKFLLTCFYLHWCQFRLQFFLGFVFALEQRVLIIIFDYLFFLVVFIHNFFFHSLFILSSLGLLVTDLYDGISFEIIQNILKLREILSRDVVDLILQECKIYEGHSRSNGAGSFSSHMATLAISATKSLVHM